MASDQGIRAWRLAVVLVVAVTGLGAIVVAERDAADEARQDQQALATEAALLVESTVEASVTAVAGADGLATPTGPVDLDSFRAYAREIVAVSPLEALAFVPVVEADDRTAFEAELGHPIVEQSQSGDLIPAAERPEYYPVRVVVPDDAATRAVLGFDLLSDPVRGAAAVTARDSGRTVLTTPVRATSSGAVSYFLVKPLYHPGSGIDSTSARRRAHAGFVTTVYAGSNLTDLLREELPAGSRFTLRDGEERLAGTERPPAAGTTRVVETSGRRWTLVVEDGRGTEQALAVSIAAFAALLVGGVLIFFRRSEQHDEAMRASAETLARIADVAQALAAAGTVSEVEDVVRIQMPAVVNATAGSLGLADRDAGVVRFVASPAVNATVAQLWAEVPLDRRAPLTESLRTGATILVPTLADWNADWPPDVVADVHAAGLVSTACIPLDDEHGQTIATLVLSWNRQIDFDSPCLAAMRTLAELCESTLDRARSTDVATRAATRLAELGSRLAAAVRVADVLEIVTQDGGRPVDATATSLGLIDPDAGVLRTHHGASVDESIRARYSDPPLDSPLMFTDAARTGLMVLVGDHADFALRYPASAAATSSLGFGARAALPFRDSDGRAVGSIVHAWAGPRVFDETLVSTLVTIADMTAQALERTNLAEAEHRLVVNLQDTVLVPLPTMEQLDIEARYLPAAEDIGMGGDWFEGIELGEGRYALILGDVAGHGITAVADMAQLRAVIGTLVRVGTPLEEVFDRVSTMLQDDGQLTASSLLVVVDCDAQQLQYVAAGHPPPLVRQPDGSVQVLEGARLPILGVVAATPVTAGEVTFPPGAVLVAYTDGLIERRGEPLDVAVDRLRRHVAEAEAPAEWMAEALLHACLEGLPPDDDVALVVIRRR